ncbi:MAG: hypothetical protein MRY74_01950 [Neomegalonema sp.]|nr:hypothetical protein [Neomegalonema sp.]
MKKLIAAAALIVSSASVVAAHEVGAPHLHADGGDYAALLLIFALITAACWVAGRLFGRKGL